MTDFSAEQRAVERAAARFIVSLALVSFAAALVWFAWVDAPITDGAMDCFAVAGLAAALATVTALLGWSLTLQGPAAPAASQAPLADPALGVPAVSVADAAAARRERRTARLRRIAVLALAAQLVLLIFACTVTLNLRGTGDDDSDDQTAQKTLQKSLQKTGL